MINLNHFNKFPELNSDRLILRQFEVKKDAPAVFKLRTNELVMTFMDNYKHSSIKESVGFIEKNLNTFASKKGIFWAIELKSTGEFIGDFAYWKIDSQHKRGEIGYSLLPEFWGRGYMKECMLILIDFGFNQLNLHSIEANINPNNNQSRELLLCLGFKKEAYFRENYYFDGNYIDSEIYSLLETDTYPSRKK